MPAHLSPHRCCGVRRGDGGGHGGFGRLDPSCAGSSPSSAVRRRGGARRRRAARPPRRRRRRGDARRHGTRHGTGRHAAQGGPRHDRPAGRRDAGAVDHRPFGSARRPRHDARARARTGPPAGRGAGAGQRRADRLPRRRWAIRNDRSRTAAAGRGVRRPRRRPGGDRRLPRDPAGAVRDRPDGGPRPRLGRRCTCSSGTTACRSTIRRWRRCSTTRPPTRCSRTARCASPAGRSASSTRQPRRSASSATTRPRSARRSRADPLLHAPVAPADAPACRCSATPAGRASGSSARRTATRSTATRASGRRRAGPVRRRRAQR